MIRPAPRLARWWLRAQLPASDRDDVAANLDELHLSRGRTRGQMGADLWYWGQALTFPIRIRMSGGRPTVRNLFPGRSLMASLLQDLRYAMRLYRARPGFAAAALLSLTLGIGLNAAIFSVVDGVLLRPAPIADIDRVVMLWQTDRNTGTTREPGSIPDFVDLRRELVTLSSLGGLIAREANFAPEAGDPTRLAALVVSHDLLPLLGVVPLRGRTFGADDEAPGGPPVVLISERLWTGALGRTPDVLGRTIRLDDQPFEIAGVVPDVTDFGILQMLGAAAYSRAFADRGTRVKVDIWQPLRPTPQSSRDSHPLIMIGRLAPGVSIADAQADATGRAADLEARYPNSNDARGAFVEPLDAVVFGPTRPALWALLGAVGLVLLVACVNVANLMLAQGAARSRELSVRLALGAAGGRLFRQLLTESLLLAVVAGVLGVALAGAVVWWFATQGPATVPRLGAVTLNLRVIAIMCGVSLGVGVLFGLVPAWQAMRTTPRTVLAAEADRTATDGRSKRRLRGALVVAELALAVVLISGAGLLIKSFWQLSQVDPGFDATSVVKAEFQLPASRYPVNFANWPDFAEIHAFNRRLEERVAGLPGVRHFSIAGNHPLDPGFTSSFVVVGREQESATFPELSVRRVTPGYFDTVGLRVAEGRAFGLGDATTSEPVAMLNAAAAARFFPDRTPVGQAIGMWGARRRVVGVVANERFHGLTADEPLAVYFPLAQTPGTNGAGVLLVRSDGRDPRSMGAEIARTIREIDPGLAVFGVEAIEDTVSRSVADRRFTMSLLALFAVMALTLAAIGVYGVLSYAVSQETREIGIRLALGASPEGVRRRILGRGLALAASGLALGALGAVALASLLQSLLFGVAATDPIVFLAVAALLASVAAAASYLPARRATRIDPGAAMRT